MNSSAFSISAGIGIGIMYAILFIVQHKMLFSRPKLKHAIVIGMTLIRLMILGLCLYLLLHSPLTNRILTLVSFTSTFWLTLFLTKIYPYARS